MICSYCDSRIGRMPDNRRCPNCGAPLEAPQFPQPPLGHYKQPFRGLEIQKDCVRFYQKFMGLKKECTIAYEELAAVCFEPGTKGDLGFLCVRDWQNRDVPMPRTHKEAVEEDTAVIFSDFFNERYRELYEFLKQCADIAGGDAVAETEDEAPPFGRYPGFYGYMELDAQAVTVYKDIKLLPATTRQIPYDEIAEVAFCEAKGSKKGGLSVRRRQDNKQMDRALRDAVTDDTSIDFGISVNGRMRQIYLFLTKHADENNRRWAQESGQETNK